MCGFGGVINTEGLDRQLLLDVSCKVSFRGPDNTGIVIFDRNFQDVNDAGSHGFFFNRLAIIDLDARSNQPYQDDRYLLLFNGEIYNYKELRADLHKLGVVFRTSSDTEVLFYALQLWGKEALSKLNGMFAFFWVDKKENRFIIARDRIGIKPVYYKIEGKRFLFASELDTIVRLAKDQSSISTEAVHQYLSLQYVPTPNTILDGVYKLPPGNMLTGSINDLENGRELLIKPYWDAYQYIQDGQGEDDDSSLEQILVDSIKGQLEADVPLGLFLSSGVDSSLLTAIINKHFKGRPYDFFTVAFDHDTHSDESSQAQAYLKGFKNSELRHHKLTVSPDFISSRLLSAYDYFDEPFGDHAALLNWAISEKAKRHVTVVLSGDGADEMFWGYPRYNEWKTQKQRIYKKVPMLSVIGSMADSLPPSRLKYTIKNMTESDSVRIHFDILRPRLFGFLPAIQQYTNLWCLEGIDKLKDRPDLAAIIDLKAYLADAMLYKVDRASMASSLEVRVPYLDNRVLDYALRLPLSQKSNIDFQNKAPLKNLLTTLAPHYQIDQPKRGFNFPLTQWMRNEWRPLMLETITKNNLEDVGLDSAPFMAILNKFYDQNHTATNEVWYLLNLVLWHKKYKTLQHSKK
jgi:asparagine synthase (glutamine-hydrolysing)